MTKVISVLALVPLFLLVWWGGIHWFWAIVFAGCLAVTPNLITVTVLNGESKVISEKPGNEPGTIEIIGSYPVSTTFVPLIPLMVAFMILLLNGEWLIGQTWSAKVMRVGVMTLVAFVGASIVSVLVMMLTENREDAARDRSESGGEE